MAIPTTIGVSRTIFCTQTHKVKPYSHHNIVAAVNYQLILEQISDYLIYLKDTKITSKFMHTDCTLTLTLCNTLIHLLNYTFKSPSKFLILRTVQFVTSCLSKWGKSCIRRMGCSFLLQLHSVICRVLTTWVCFNIKILSSTSLMMFSTCNDNITFTPCSGDFRSLLLPGCQAGEWVQQQRICSSWHFTIIIITHFTE